MKLSKKLKVLSKIYLVFAVLTVILKVVIQNELKMIINGADVPKGMIVAFVFNVLYNFILFVGGYLLCEGIARLVEVNEDKAD